MQRGQERAGEHRRVRAGQRARERVGESRRAEQSREQKRAGQSRRGEQRAERAGQRRTEQENKGAEESEAVNLLDPTLLSAGKSVGISIVKQRGHQQIGRTGAGREGNLHPVSIKPADCLAVHGCKRWVLRPAARRLDRRRAEHGDQP